MTHIALIAPNQSGTTAPHRLTGRIAMIALGMAGYWAIPACLPAQAQSQQVQSQQVQPQQVQQDSWGAAEIRRLMREYLQLNGKQIPKDKDIWPLDDRLSLPACLEKPEIIPRSAHSTTYMIRCPGPTAWAYTVSVEHDTAGPARAQTMPTPQKTALPQPQNTQTALSPPPMTGNSAIARDMFTAVVPRVDLASGTILTADMLEERQVPQSPGVTAFKSVQEAVGLRLTAAVGPSSILNTRNVAKAPSVLKGETVTLKSGGPNFEIMMPGRAEADGYEGDIIPVKNIKTGAKLVGKLGPGGIVQLK